MAAATWYMGVMPVPARYHACRMRRGAQGHAQPAQHCLAHAGIMVRAGFGLRGRLLFHVATPRRREARMLYQGPCKIRHWGEPHELRQWPQQCSMRRVHVDGAPHPSLPFSQPASP